MIDTARNIGWKSAYEKVATASRHRHRLATARPDREAVDEGNSRFRSVIGGLRWAECAFHAEYIAVPDML
ncbi:MAG: hypothetical protein Ct9H300mP32_4380 [Verrucomicrobiota bacterium]|nr:MAG: hypothetical protein Ct9H300mP32_4380 [Verrucomicrobiota bacterium]